MAWASRANATISQDVLNECVFWHHLRHPNILKFLGVTSELFNGRLCLISPWMEHRNVMDYFKSRVERGEDCDLKRSDAVRAFEKLLALISDCFSIHDSAFTYRAG
jgi:serine/threonine protein kinase